jgi:hypothetical protein
MSDTPTVLSYFLKDALLVLVKRYLEFRTKCKIKGDIPQLLSHPTGSAPFLLVCYSIIPRPVCDSFFYHRRVALGSEQSTS